MLSNAIKASGSEVTLFTSGEYDNDVEEFQTAVNSWLSGQPQNVVIEDVIYQHCGITSRGKDIFSVLIISRSA
ncbi:hypothetical protein ACFLYN_05285 [Chloroflexota bacterium]